MKILLDPGHGAYDIHKGYTTPGKRSPRGAKGIIYEGMSNRAFAFNVAYMLTLEDIDVEVINASTNDVPVEQRAMQVNKIIGTNKASEYLLISVHSNAAPTSPVNTFTNATGLEIYTATTASARTTSIATKMAQSLKASLPEIVWRNGLAGSLVKQQNFTIIKKTRCPAVLLEILFMNGTQDYTLLASPQWRAQFESAFVKAIKDCAELGSNT